LAAGNPAAPAPAQAPPPPPLAQSMPPPAPAPASFGAGRWWSYDDGRAQQPAEPARAAPAPTEQSQGEDFPRIVRTRLRS